MSSYHRVTLFLATLTALAAMALATPDDAHAVTPLCEARGQAHIEKHGGLAKDSAEHVIRGELPTCDPNPDKASSPPQHEDKHDDKSRYCKRKWFC